MTVAAVLLGYAACVGTLGARMLGRASWTARAPLLAIGTYLAACWSVVAALGLAGLTLAVHASALGGGLSQLIGACALRLRAVYATPGGATVAGLGLLLAGAVTARITLTAVSHHRAVARQARWHAQTARLVAAAPGRAARPGAPAAAGRHHDRAHAGSRAGGVRPSRAGARAGPGSGCLTGWRPLAVSTPSPGYRSGKDKMRNPLGGRRRCWCRHRKGRPPLPPASAGAGIGKPVAGAVQMAIGLLTASLDSPELETWAAMALIPEDPAALGDFLAGLHVVSQLLLAELEESTGQPAAATLQKLAILAETR